MTAPLPAFASLGISFSLQTSSPPCISLQVPWRLAYSSRSLLFVDVASLANPVETVHLPALVVLHHIIVLSPLRLPHEVHGWSEAEYVLWLQSHENEKEHWSLLEKAVDDQVGQGAGSGEGEGVHIRLIREVLEHARAEDQSPGVG